MARIIDQGGSFSSTPPVTLKADGTAIEITDAALLFNADFSRSGSDLVLVGADGKTIIIIDYFAADQTVDLLSPDGAVLSADVVAALAGPLAPAQYAQTGTPAGSIAIGQVETLTGTATATRENGTIVELKVGTHVFQGDVIQTGDGSSLGITFLDQTVFSLSDNARMVLNEMVYDPGGSSNSMLMNLVQGSFVFVAGQIAPTGDMKIQTPVATMGIRGTSPTVFIADNGTVAFSIIPDPGPEGKIGKYVLFDNQGQVIGSVNDTGSKLLLTSAGGQVQELAKTAGDFTQDQQVQAQVYSVFNSLQGRIDSGQSPVELNSTGSEPDTNPDNPDNQPDQSQNTPADGAPEVTGSIDSTPASGGAGESSVQSTAAPETTATDALNTGNDSSGQGPAFAPLGGASDPVINSTPITQPLNDPTDNPVNPVSQITGTPGNDLLTGTAGNDLVQGLDGVDFLNGGAGNDVLDGGLGADTLTGGAGADTFVLGADVPDVIIDFNTTEDILDLSNLLGPNFDIANLSDFVQLQETGSSTVRIDSDGAANGANFIDVAVLEDIFAGEELNFIFDARGSTGSVISADRNVAPVAQDDVFATNEDAGINSNVLADNGNGPDVDPENEQLVVVELNGSAANVGTPVILASGAVLTLNGDGTFAYDPNGQFEGLNSNQSATDTFDYTLNDGKDGFDTATVTVNISGVNDAPVTGNVQLTVSEDSEPVTEDFLVSDVDAGSAVASFNIVTQPAGGTLVNNNDGTFTFSPGTALQSLAQGVAQELVFTFTATDNEGAVSTPGNVTITITGQNDAPIAIDDRIRTNEDRILNGDVFEDNTDGEDEDIDINDAFSVVQVNGSAADVGTEIVLTSGALLTLNADGTFDYDPNGLFDTLAFGQSATDSYTYTIQDTQGASDTATVTIIINGVNDAPVITSAATVQVAENTSIVQQVTANDIDVNVGSQLFFSLTGNGPDDAFFVIDGNGILSFQVPPDFENPLDTRNDNTYNVEVAVSDGIDTTTRVVAVTVSDVNDNAPVITSANIVDVAENSSNVQQVTASDTDTVGVQIFSLTGKGADDALFAIDGVTGVLSFQVSLDFENPLDTGNNNVYNVEVAVSDGVNPATPQAIAINVTDVNDTAPVIISPNSASIAENTTFALQVVATDADSIGVQTFSLTGNGADDALFVIDGLGNLRFQAPPDFENPLDTGNDNAYNVDVSVSDGVSTTTQAVAVSVTDINEAPVARNDAFNTDEETDIFSNVLADNGLGADFDPENNQLTITAVNGQTADVGSEITLASGASLNLSGNGDFLYDTNISGAFNFVPVGGVAQDSFTYTVSDGNGGFDTATATINIAGVNDAPVAGIVQLAATEDGGPVTAGFNASDVDAGGTVTSFDIVSQPAAGNVVNNNDGTFTYSPGTALQSLAQGVTQDLVFTFTATDNEGAVSAPGTATITVTGANDAPIANDDRVRTNEDTILNGDVFEDNSDGEDEDIDINDVFSVVAVNGNTASVGNEITLESGALLTVDTDGIFDYDPNGRFEDLGVGQRASDTYTYTIQDSQGATGTATVTITINGVNNAPVALDDGLATNENAILSGDVFADNGNGADSDIDNGDVISVLEINGVTADVGAQIALASGALLTLNADGTFAYDPNGQFNALNLGQSATDTFNYTIDDGSGGTDTATVTIAVNGLDITNAAPVAQDDFFVIDENGNIDGDVLAGNGNGSDFDPEGNQLTITAVNGQVGNVDSELTLPSGAFLIVFEDGSFVYDTSNEFDFLPEGGFAQDSFTYTISDGDGGSATAEVLIDIQGVNDDPVANDDALFTDENIVLNADVFANNEFGGDFDIDDGDVFTVTELNGNVSDIGVQVALASGALVTLDADGTFAYDPNGQFESLGSGQTTTDSFDYTIEDGNGGFSSATATVTVTGVNDAPIAQDDEFFGDEDFGFNGNVLVDNGNGPDSDPEGDLRTVTAVNGQAANVGALLLLASGALLTLNASGAFAYDPNGAFENLSDGEIIFDGFDYTISDGNGGFSTATANVEVLGANDAPIVVVVPNEQFATVNSAFFTGFDPLDVFFDIDDFDVLTLDAQLDNGDLLPNWLTFDGTDFFGTPTAIDGGTITVELTGSDDLGESEFITFDIIVSGDILGTTGNDNLQGNVFANLIQALGGNDRISASPGGDVIDGGLGTDTISFINNSQSLSVNLLTQSSSSAETGNDTLISIENVIGGAGDDTITGNGSNNTLLGRGGDDTLDGGAGDDVIDGGSGINFLTGGAGNDTLIGGTLGDDNSNNRADYSLATGGITAILQGSIRSLQSTVTGDASVGSDMLDSIEVVIGSQFDDTFTIQRDFIGQFGDFNEVLGEGGDDIIFGNGATRVDFRDATGGVTVDFEAALGDPQGLEGRAFFTSGGGGLNDNVGVDSFTGVNSVSGSEFDDTVFGSNGNQFENFRLRGGNDQVDGRGGDNDQLDYKFSAPAGINADFTTNAADGSGTVQDGFGTVDTFSNIERIRGTEFDDIITGDGGNNQFRGEGGNDVIDGGGGNDILIGGFGDNRLIGGAGNDTLIGAATLDNDLVDFNRVDYRSATAGITVDFRGGLNSFSSTATGDASVGTDILVNAEFIFGTDFADTFSVDNTFANRFGNFVQIEGGAGDDVINGNGGVRIGFTDAQDSVTVDFVSGTATSTNTGDAANIGNDTFTGVNSVRGSSFDDILTGSGASFESFRGQAGNDFIDGGAGGSDQSDYRNSPGGIVVDLSGGAIGDGTVQDGFGSVDTLVGIENIRASNFDDILIGDAGDNVFRPRFGDDTITGGLGNDTIRYSQLDDDQIIDLGAGTATGAQIGNDTFTGIENAIGGGGNDLIIGDAGDNILRGGLGDNILIGGAGNDILRGASTFIDSRIDFNRVDYRGATAGIVVELRDGINSFTSTAVGDASVGTDILVNAEFIFGTNFADTFTIDASFDGRFGTFIEIEGGAGNDTIIRNATGGTRVGYKNAADSVTVNLELGTAFSTNAGDTANIGIDTLVGVTSVRGSNFDDILIGSNGAQSELFRGQAGNDLIDGGGGASDQADYRNSPNGVFVDLSGGIIGSGTAQDGFFDQFGNVGIDTLVNIENIRGSEFGDELIGDDGANRIQGRAGADLIDGGAGNDDLRGGDGQDLIRGGAGSDTITGGADADTLFGGDGNDQINGGNGNDRIAGDVGIDTLTGGGGQDIFEFTGFSTDIVTDFVVGQDRLDLAALIGGNFTIPTRGNFVRAVENAGNTTIQVDSDGALNGQNFLDVAILNNVGTGSAIDFFFDQQSDFASVLSAAPLPVPQTVIELSALDGTNGFALNGVAGFNQAGVSVSSAGDFNGDGFDDVIIGANFADSNGNFNAGGSYVVFGQAGGFSASLELSALNGTNGFVINGVAGGDNSGLSVSSAGDINGDGIADVIIGAEQADPNGTASGASYVVFGQAGGFSASLNLSSLNGTNGFVLNGIDAFDLSGGSVASVGDINGDGIDDLIIGATRGDTNGADTGESYVVFGQAGGFGTSFDLSTLAAGNGSTGFVINGIDTIDRSGISVSSAGDINGDGIADLIIGARDADQIGGNNAGEAYVVFGQAGGFGASLELSALNGTNGFVLNGIDGNDTAGNAVSSAGDINGDGFDDLIIAAFAGDPNGGQTGETYVVFGQAASFGASFELSTLAAGNGSTGFVINGIDTNDRSGVSVSSAGDINGDGFDDLIIGAQRGDPNGLDAGESYVVFGKANGFGASLELSALDGTNGFIINGIDAGDLSGSVSAAGDVNNDGFDDLIIGASLGDPNGTSSGESYIIFGAAFGANPAPITTTGTTADEVIIGGLGNDLLVGNGGADVIRGGAGDDIIAISDDFFARIDGGTGIDTLRFDGAGLNPNSPGGNGIITGIERIDITGSGDNTILLDKPDVFTITDERSGGIASITVTGDAGDAVSFDDLGWSNAGQITIGADTFNRIINGNAEVLVQDTVGTVIPGAQASVIELATLNGTNGFVLNGVAGSDFSGGSVSSAGDVNGDGFDDVIIGARLADFNGGVDVGTSYVVFGNGSGFGPNFNLSSLNGINGFAINGINSNGQSGFSVAYAGDINNDGFDDVIIGAPGTVLNNNGAGASYVVFGQAGGFGANLSLSSLNGSNGFVINGVNAGDSSGSSVSSAGDINGDGIDDVIIGAVGADPNGSFSGASYVVFGQAGGFSASLGLASLNGTNGFVINGVAASDQSGRSVSAAGDVNGDGIGDVIISAPLANPNGLDSGASYVVFGKSSGFGASLELSSLDGTNGFVINGINSNDLSGRSVSSAGDINGDGFDDVIIGAERADPNGNSSGESYVVFGRAGGFGASLELSALDGTNGFVINGIDVGDQSGISVSSAGDVNGDGFGDIIIGAETADGVNGSDSGESYVVFGKAGGFSATLELSTLDGTNGFIINGIDGGDRSGGSVSSAGDVNNDGFDDLIIGADLADPTGTNSGESYIIFGSPFGNGVILGTPGSDNLIGTTGTDILRGLGSDDTLQGINGNDLLLGGAGNDELLGGSDNDILDGEAGSDSLTGGPGSDIFRFSDASAVDTVTDFTIGQDQLDLSQLLDASFTGVNVNDFIRISKNAGNAIVTVDSNGLATGENFINVGNLIGIVENDNISILFNNGLSNTNVTVTAGAPFSTITGTAFEDGIVGTSGADIINGLGGSDTLLGLDGDDILFGGAGIDLLRGGGGDDVLVGGANINALTGGAGFDLFVFDSLGVNLVTDFSINDDTLDFSSLLGGNFTIPAQDDFIRATSAGGNTIVSIDGDGSLNGADFTAVAVLSGVGQGSVITTLTTSVISTAPAVVISGTGGDDGLVGTAGNDFIEGFAGNDILDGGSSGVDALSGGAGADIFVLDLQGVDLVTDFNSAEDILDLSGPLLAGGSFTVGAVDDFIDITDLGGTSVISIDFDGLNNGDNFIPIAILPTVAAGEQVTFIFDGTGTTATVQTLPDFNVITGTPAGETLTGTVNEDVITAFAGDDTLIGLDNNDLLLGGDGNDFLSGGNDDDALDGGVGDDVLIGDGGNNILTGGGGFDLFVLTDTFGLPRFDTITDFDLVEDTLDLGDLLDANFTNGPQGDFIEAIDNGQGDTVLSVDADGAGALAGFEAVAVLEGIVAGDSINFIFDVGLAGTSNIVVA